MTNELIKRIYSGKHISEDEMARVEKVQEIIEKFDLDPKLRDHYRSGHLKTDLKLEGYTDDEIGLAEIRLGNIQKNRAIAKAFNDGEIQSIFFDY